MSLMNHVGRKLLPSIFIPNIGHNQSASRFIALTFLTKNVSNESAFFVQRAHPHRAFLRNHREFLQLSQCLYFREFLRLSLLLLLRMLLLLLRLLRHQEGQHIHGFFHNPFLRHLYLNQRRY